jgi:hypothetical protein
MYTLCTPTEFEYKLGPSSLSLTKLLSLSLTSRHSQLLLHSISRTTDPEKRTPISQLDHRSTQDQYPNGSYQRAPRSSTSEIDQPSTASSRSQNHANIFNPEAQHRSRTHTLHHSLRTISFKFLLPRYCNIPHHNTPCQTLPKCVTTTPTTTPAST